MATVRIDSGEFPLMRNIDVSHQPSRSKVYTAWSRAFGDNIPAAVDHLADVIEDVYSYELWKDKYLDTPEEFFERYGLFDLDLDEPAKLLKELRKEKSSKKNQIIKRARQAKEMREQGMTQQDIADELGVHRNTVVSDLCTENSVITPKIVQEKRKVVGYRITEYTKAEVAAVKIRDILGDEFADELKALL